MSTSTPTVTTVRKPKTARTHGKNETIEMDLILTDRLNELLKGPKQEVTVGLTFDIVEMGDGYAVAAYRDFIPEEKVSMKLHKGSIAFEANSNYQLVELMRLDDNIESFTKAFRARGYRISNRDEFIPWHSLHCDNYKKNDLQPKQKSINGGLSEKAPGGREFPMFEAGYAMEGGNIYAPTRTYMDDELGPIFIGDDWKNRTAILLIAL